MYADCETLLKKPEKEVYNSKCSTIVHHEHEAHSIGYYFKNENDVSESYYAIHRGPDCVNWFICELKKIAIEVFEYLEDKKPMRPLSVKEEKLYNEATNCHICKQEFEQFEC